MIFLDTLKPCLRQWPVLTIGVGIGLLVGHVLEATAQTIIDPTLSPMTSGMPQEPGRLVGGINGGDPVDQRLEAVRHGGELLAEQLRTIEARLSELRELQASIDSGCDPAAAATDEDAAALRDLADIEDATTRADETLAAARARRVAELSQTLTSMNRNAAAELITALEPELAAELLRQLSPRDGGRILDRVTPQVAAELSALLLVPDDGDFQTDEEAAP